MNNYLLITVFNLLFESVFNKFHMILGKQCQDDHEQCKNWAKAGFCTLSPDPMLTTCANSCGICNGVCKDNFPDCPGWAKNGFCLRTEGNTDHEINFMWNNCKKSCGICTGGMFVKEFTNITKNEMYETKNALLSLAPTTKPPTETTTTETTTTSNVLTTSTTTPTPSTTTPTEIITTEGPTVITKGGISTPSKKFIGITTFYCMMLLAITENKRCLSSLYFLSMLYNEESELKFFSSGQQYMVVCILLHFLYRQGVLCKDRSRHCKSWAEDGRCDTDRWVHDNCLLSCNRNKICDKEIIKPVGKFINITLQNLSSKMLQNFMIINVKVIWVFTSILHPCYCRSLHSSTWSSR